MSCLAGSRAEPPLTLNLLRIGTNRTGFEIGPNVIVI